MVEYGTPLSVNVFARRILSGMEIFAYNAVGGKCINLTLDVPALQAYSTMAVNVHKCLSTNVLQYPAQFGMENLVFVIVAMWLLAFNVYAKV